MQNRTLTARRSGICDSRAALWRALYDISLVDFHGDCAVPCSPWCPNVRVGSMHNRRVNKAQPSSSRPVFDTFKKPLSEQSQRDNVAKKPSGRRQEGSKTSGGDKENAGQSAKTSSGKPVPGYLRATTSSRSKTGPSEEWTFSMVDQLESLQGDFLAMKRDSVRLSLAGAENALPAIAAPSPAQASMHARSGALKHESFQALDNPLSSAGDTPLRELEPSNAPGAATYSTLMPTLRGHLRLTGVPEQRLSLPEADPFESAGQWEAPSLAQVAEELFSDSAFAEMCERGLTMQLKRTKDGATAETRIAELAGQLSRHSLAPGSVFWLQCWQ